MVRTCAILLLALAAPAFAGTGSEIVPAGPLSHALALVEANRLPDAMKVLAPIRPDMALLGPYHYVYGRIFSAARDPRDAAAHFWRAGIYATNPALKERSRFLAAEADFRIGNFFESATACRLFLKKYPDSPRVAQARVLLAESLQEVGRSKEAVRQFELAGKTGEALYGKANALQEMGKTREATQAYAAAAAVDPHYIDSSEATRYWRGENLRLSGDIASAGDLLSTVRGDRLRDRAAVALGEIAAAESRLDEAAKRFTSVRSSKDGFVRRAALLGLAGVDAAGGNGAKAAERLEEIVRRYPFTRESDEALLRLARLRTSAGNYPAAVSCLIPLVVRASPRRKEALDAMEAVLLAARGKGPARFAALWNNGGRWLLDASRETSLEAFREELRGSGAPYLELVRWLARYGTSDARKRNLLELAGLLAEAGDANGVRECLTRILALREFGDDLLRVKAALKYAEKDYRGAGETLLSLQKIEGRDASMLSETIPYLPDRRKAAAVLEIAASRSHAEPRELSRVADAMYEAGCDDLAVKYYRETLAKDPANEWACYRMAVLLGKKGGEEYLERIKTDPTLVRMARAARKEMSLDAQ
jgi:tetratricopeptide (TPR) repeat protein